MFFENYYDSEEDQNDYIDSYEYDTFKNHLIQLEIVSFYKELLEKEPEFIGIKNICSEELLNIIKSNNDIKKFEQKKFSYELNYDQILIFNRMYDDLGINNFINNIDIFKLVTKKIFRRVYV